MATGSAFADILDRELGAPQPESRSRRVPFTSRPAPPHPFLFTIADRQFGAAAYGWRAPRPPAPPLTPRQQSALARLVELGASLRPGFTAGELRSAFRVLARKYHPDRHPGTSTVEAARFSALFTEMTTNYRQLIAMCDRSAAA